MKKETIYILHEYGAPRHFESLMYLNNNDLKADIIQVEFLIWRRFIKSLIMLDYGKAKRTARNFTYLIKLLLGRNNKIIIGAAPYDTIVWYLSILKKNNQVIYYSSWPYWDKTKYPKKIYTQLQYKLWIKFLKNIKSVVVTEKVRQGLSDFTKDITVIPHCINTKIFYPKTNRNNNNKIRILFVGRLTKSKGVDLIVNMIKSIPNPDIQWEFIGDGELSDLIKELAFQDKRVKYHGFLTQNVVSSIYRESDILLLPSIKTKEWEELFGIVLIEAMACGVVPITTRSIGPLQIIEDYKDGLFINSNDILDLEDKVMFLVNNKKIRKEMSQSAIHKAREKYSIENTASIWKNVMQRF